MKEKAENESAHRADLADLEQRREPEEAPSGAVLSGMVTGGPPPPMLGAQMRYLQRTAGNRAVQRLITTSGAPAQAIHVQRLAYDEPIPARAVKSVFHVPRKSTYIVTGRDGSKVVVKFEPGPGGESLDQRRARISATNRLAKLLLPNVPSFAFVSDTELAALSQIPALLGAGAKDLADHAADVLAGRIPDVPLKLEFADVGDNLGDMMKKAGLDVSTGPGPGRPAPPLPPGAVPAGGPAPTRPQAPTPQLKTEAMQVLQGNNAVWVDLGRLAAFDLFIGNDDRFHYKKPTVNFENLDFTSRSDVIALDNFNPNASMNLVDTDDRMFGPLPSALQSTSGMKTYVRAVVSHICSEAGIVALDTYDQHFALGFEISRNALKAQKVNIKDAVNRATRDNDDFKGKYFSWLLTRVKKLK